MPPGDAAIEEIDGNPRFVIRNKGFFSQDVELPGAVGKYVLIIGRVSSERINPDGAITGLPYLYAYLLQGMTADWRAIDYINDPTTLGRPKEKDQWVYAWGVHRVPEKTDGLRFFLNQAERKNVPQNGSAARFDDLGLYLFDTKEEADAFAKSLMQKTP
ncbi:MAG TPA: hypothetical protein VFC63_22350 [Blastocatellia bacterium]|nr:hypothetical protein [Blastocatellia bacterium]